MTAGDSIDTDQIAGEQKAMSTRGSLDGFLDYSSKAPKTGGYLGGWKKNKDEDHGELMAWLHVQFMPTPFWCHPTYTVIETKEEKLVPVPRRWTCHEDDAIAKLQKWRLDDGTSEHRPIICPECILTNVIARMVDRGELGFTDVVFEWNGTDDADAVQILAGGIYGHFRKKKGLHRDQEVAMRRAKVRQTDAFKHDMRTALKYEFAVLDGAHIDRGMQIAVESEGLANKIRAAILAEGMKVQALTRIDMRDDRVRGQWDPSINPYPLLLQYDNTKDFDDKFNVVALRGTEITDEIRALIVESPKPDAPDLEPGSCYQLRAELEAACRVKLPWDEIFRPAAEKGLMNPPQESKGEVDEARSERTPEINTRTQAVEPKSGEPIRIGPAHPAWTNKAYKPGPEYKGAELHVLPPDGATDADVDRVLRVLGTVAKVVAEVVACEHCNGEMTTVDPTCPTCGAGYDDDGKLTSRPCANDPCDGQVLLEGDGPRYICPKCASIHELDGDGAWKVVPNEPSPAASPRRRRSGGTASTGGGATFP